MCRSSLWTVCCGYKVAHGYRWSVQYAHTPEMVIWCPIEASGDIGQVGIEVDLKSNCKKNEISVSRFEQSSCTHSQWWHFFLERWSPFGSDRTREYLWCALSQHSCVGYRLGHRKINVRILDSLRREKEEVAYSRETIQSFNLSIYTRHVVGARL